MKDRTVSSPKISANKLGEYLIATPARRKTIIRDQKSPPTIKVARYQQAKEAAEEYFLSGGTNTKGLDAAIVRLRSKKDGSNWAREDAESTAQALDLLLSMRDQLFSDGLVYVAAPAHPAKLMISGVEVSVQPHMLLIDEKRRKIGAVRLHYVKSADLADKGGEYVATLLTKWTAENAPRSGYTVAPALCRCVDVFRKAITKAPASQIKRMSDIAAACEEIAVRWNTIQ